MGLEGCIIHFHLYGTGVGAFEHHGGCHWESIVACLHAFGLCHWRLGYWFGDDSITQIAMEYDPKTYSIVTLPSDPLDV